MITTESVNFSETIYSRVRDALREEILSGKLEPGSRLKIAEVCQRFNISHMPVREALAQLQGEGIVVIAPNKGAVVREMDTAFVRNIFQIRSALEQMMTRLSVPHLEDYAVKAIIGLSKNIEAAFTRMNQQQAFDLDKQFHLMTYSEADNPEALKLLNRHWELLGGLRARYGYGTERPKQIIAEHQQLVQAISIRDSEAASQIQQMHSEHAMDDMIERMNIYEPA